MVGLNFGALFKQEPIYSDDGKLAIEGAQDWAGRNATQIFPLGQAVGNTTTTVYTVPASTVLYLTHYTVSFSKNVAASVGFNLRIGLAAFQRFNMSVVPNANFFIGSGPYGMPIKLTAGQTLQITCEQATGEITASFQGWLENA